MQKYAAFEVLAVERASGEVIREAEQIVHEAAVRAGFAKAAHRHEFAYNRRPGFIYVRSRAISSRTNDNFDAFPAEEIKKAWVTFKGKPVFVNHHNANHKRARGFIIDAALHEDTNPDGTPDTWVEVLMEVDAVRFPRLAEAVIRGDIARTSMGTDVQYSVCTACGKRAETPADYCRHIPAMKGMKMRRFNAAIGRHEEVLVAETCYGLGFFENSLLVEDPADPTAHRLGQIEAEWDTLPENLRNARTASAGNREEVVDGLVAHASLSKTADEDQCPHCAGDSLMVEGSYICESGHIWEPDGKAAHAYHDESSPSFGQIQPVAKIGSLLGLQTATLISEAEGLTREAVSWRDVADFFAGGRDPRNQCEACGRLFRWSPEAHKFVCPAGHATFPYDLREAAMQSTAIGEIKAPSKVDTLRADRCPVCKDDEAFNGEKCSVCGHVEPPEHFRDPDTSKAREMDLRQENAEDGAVGPDGLPLAPGDPNFAGDPDASISDEVAGPMGAETGDQEVPDLQCTNCGEIFSAEGDDATGDSDPEDPEAATDPDHLSDPKDPEVPEVDGHDDLSDLADKSDEDLGLEEAVDPKKPEDPAADPKKVDPADVGLKDRGPAEHDKHEKPLETEPDPLKPHGAPEDLPKDLESHPDPGMVEDPHKGEQDDDEGHQHGDSTFDGDDHSNLAEIDGDVVAHGPCPVCGAGTLEPMEAPATAQVSEDVDGQQALDPTRPQTV